MEHENWKIVVNMDRISFSDTTFKFWYVWIVEKILNY